MEANITSSVQASSRNQPLDDVARQAFVLGSALIALLCLVVVVRGMLGAFSSPRSVAFVLITTVAAVAYASLYRILWRHLHSSASRHSILISRLGLPAMCVVCVAIALSIAGANAWVVGSVWIAIAASELAWWLPEWRGSMRRTVDRDTEIAAARTFLEAAEDDDQFVNEEEEFGEHIIQQVTRLQNDAGIEVVQGVLRAQFVVGERTQILHVAFCPPLDYEPQIITHQLDGAPVIIKVAQAEVFGTRLELRLTTADRTAQSVAICFEAEPPSSREPIEAN